MSMLSSFAKGLPLGCVIEDYEGSSPTRKSLYEPSTIDQRQAGGGVSA
ncbi:MAG: hypothetical protein HY291_03235 [Planctomycetes bacterium]|nr:hypothetical protein [Planctomycetota bacterium]